MLGVAVEPGTRLLLIRHGETEWNREERIQGHRDVCLSARGEEQARRLARWLAEEALDAVYTSDLLRCSSTAEIVVGGREAITADSRLREARFGAFEGMTAAEIQERYPEPFRLWRQDAVRNRPPDGETLEELQERCLASLREHLPRHSGQTVAVVAHGGPIRTLVCGILGLPMEIYPRLRVENASITLILFTTRGPVLAGFNETAHLRDTTAAPQHTGWEEK
jgi:broad specificity phosphatase PhoE